MSVLLAAVQNAAKNQRAIFGASVTAAPNTPVLTVKYAAREWPEGSEVELSGCRLPQVSSTYACVLQKFSGVFGAEAGFNEKGLYAGRCAALCKTLPAVGQLSGADAVRLALERCSTADEALSFVSGLCTDHTVSGDSRHSGNVFLFADRDGIRQLEQTGPYWVSAVVEDFVSCSNELTLCDGYSDSSAAFKECAAKNSKKGKADFAALFSDRAASFRDGASIRRFSALEQLFNDQNGRSQQGLLSLLTGHAKHDPANGISETTAILALRAHYPQHRNGNEDVCTHSGTEQAQACFAANIASDIVYIPSGSVPCLSVFLPMSLKGELPLPDSESAAFTRWKDHELMVRNLLCGIVRKTDYYQSAASLEEKLLTASRDMLNCTPQEATELNSQLWQKERDFTSTVLTECHSDIHKLLSLSELKVCMRYRNANAEFDSIEQP